MNEINVEPSYTDELKISGYFFFKNMRILLYVTSYIFARSSIYPPRRHHWYQVQTHYCLRFSSQMVLWVSPFNTKLVNIYKAHVWMNITFFNFNYCMLACKYPYRCYYYLRNKCLCFAWKRSVSYHISHTFRCTCTQ